MDENLGLVALGTANVGYFSCAIVGVQFVIIRCTVKHFRSYDFQNATLSTITTFYIYSNETFANVPCNSSHNSYLLKF